MIALSAAEVASIVGGELVGTSGAEVTSVEIDSRDVGPGTLFVALPGEHADGHAFISSAFARGAAAAMVTRQVEAPGPQILVPDAAAALGMLAREVLARLRPSGIEVVGITGSAGKTTTKDMLSQMLAARGPVVAPVASFNNEIGLPLTVLRADEQTATLVLEMGADAPGNLTYLTGIAPPDIAVVLMVGRAHLDGLGSLEGVAAAKSELVMGLAPGGLAVLNADDARVAAMAPLAQRVLWFGQSARAQVRAEDVRADDDGHARLDLVDARGPAPRRRRVRLAVVGEHHVANALAASAVALAVGMDLESVAAALEQAGPVSAHRMAVRTVGGITVIDDAYNANPESMRAALKALAAMTGPGRRSVAVLGQMRELGQNALAEHDEIGRLAVRLNIGRLITVGEGAKAIHTGACHEGSWGDESVYVPSLEAAHAELAHELREGDVVLVKSSNGAGLAALADSLIQDLADRSRA